MKFLHVVALSSVYMAGRQQQRLLYLHISNLVCSGCYCIYLPEILASHDSISKDTQVSDNAAAQFACDHCLFQ